MQVKINNGIFEFIIDGPISEKTEIFSTDLRLARKIIVNFDRLTFINSIGVKNWVSWINSISPKLIVDLVNCPFVVINQISIVHGFLTGQAAVESMKVPFVCTGCAREAERLMLRNKDYFYATEQEPRKVLWPVDLKCEKCKSPMEPDLVEAKSFKFLDERKVI